MAAGVLDQCPICRARLDGSGPCRRCRAELDAVRRVAEESAALAGAGLQRFAAGDRAAAIRLIRRARMLRTTPDLDWILSALASGKDFACAPGDPDPINGAAKFGYSGASPKFINPAPSDASTG